MEQLDRVVAERAILVGLNADCFKPEETATYETLDELEALLETAGGTCEAKVLQNRKTPDPHSFIGEGKAQEVCELLENTGANMVIFDNELSPSQIRALEEITGVTVLDRSALILDIFAQRAKTAEGRLQVELAQYKYVLPRLSGMGKSMSRLGGGIGTRGPGETKLETDRRHIRERINRLQEELEAVRKVRGVQRERRLKNSVPVVALVGYTNAGKSTLLNLLTDAGIPANNRLFDTLDTTTRKLRISDHLEVLLSDTVGFIAKLPHHLVEAFKATLEELQYADLLLHVIDASDPEREAHIAVVDKLIEKLAKPGVSVLRCYNKVDLLSDPTDVPVGDSDISICARSGLGAQGLLSRIEEALTGTLHQALFLLPYSQGGILEILHKQAQVLRTDYTAEGIEVEAVCSAELFGRYSAYLKENEG
ncbi:MAG: GTPase HflX [Oscillospiraceae bacterium]|nr:GTPase HflX [Oscillospiraceae bacterium]